MAKKLARIRKQKYKQQNGRCYYCSCLMWEDRPSPCHRDLGKRQQWLRSTAEHLRSKRDGGLDAPQNIVAACQWCNRKRHGRPIPLEPVQYRKLVQGRVAAGRWHGLTNLTRS